MSRHSSDTLGAAVLCVAFLIHARQKVSLNISWPISSNARGTLLFRPITSTVALFSYSSRAIYLDLNVQMV